METGDAIPGIPMWVSTTDAARVVDAYRLALLAEAQVNRLLADIGLTDVMTVATVAADGRPMVCLSVASPRVFRRPDAAGVPSEDAA